MNVVRTTPYSVLPVDKWKKKMQLIILDLAFVLRASLDPQVGRFWPTGHMFNIPYRQSWCLLDFLECSQK